MAKITKSVMNNIHKTVTQNKQAKPASTSQPAVKKITTKTVHFDSPSSPKQSSKPSSPKKK
jgi:hypothetical protein